MINSLKTYKVWVITTSLGTLRYQLENPFDPSLDQYLWNTAVNQNINSDGLETIQEQINIFDDLSLETQIEYLNETLDYIEEYNSEGMDPLENLIDLYINGDIEEIYEYSLSDFDSNDSVDVTLKNKLFTNRNYNFTYRIIDNISKKPDKTFFFAIGSAHFHGQEGILQLLENQNYNITRIDFEKLNNCNSELLIKNERCYYSYQ